MWKKLDLMKGKQTADNIYILLLISVLCYFLLFLSRLTVGEDISMVYTHLFLFSVLVFLNVFCCSFVVYRLRSQHTSL